MKISFPANKNLNQNLPKIAIGLFVLAGLYYLVKKLSPSPSFQQLFTRTVPSPSSSSNPSSNPPAQEGKNFSTIQQTLKESWGKAVYQIEQLRHLEKASEQIFQALNKTKEKDLQFQALKDLCEDIQTKFNDLDSKYRKQIKPYLYLVLNLSGNDYDKSFLATEKIDQAAQCFLILHKISSQDNINFCFGGKTKFKDLISSFENLLFLNPVTRLSWGNRLIENIIQTQNKLSTALIKALVAMGYDSNNTSLKNLKSAFPAIDTTHSALNESETQPFFKCLAFIRDFKTSVPTSSKNATTRIENHTAKLHTGTCEAGKLQQIKPWLPKNLGIDSENYGYTCEDDIIQSAIETQKETPIQNLEAYSAHWKGGRNSQEDRHIYTTINVEVKKEGGVKENLIIPIMGILDGHGGNKCADHVKKYLPKTIEDNLQYFINENEGQLNDEVIYNALKLAFPIVRDHYLITFGSDISGTTVNLSLLIGNKLFTANSGDSKSVLGRKTSPTEQSFTGQELSKEHKPENQRRHLEKRGAALYKERIPKCERLGDDEAIDTRAKYRAANKFLESNFLAVGRSIEGLIIGLDPRPTITVHNLEGGETLSYFCDGLGDYLQETENFEKKVISASSVGAFAASLVCDSSANPAKDLVRLGIGLEQTHRGRDNISALVVKLPDKLIAL